MTWLQGLSFPLFLLTCICHSMGLSSSYFKLLGKIISNNFNLANEFGFVLCKYKGNWQTVCNRKVYSGVLYASYNFQMSLTFYMLSSELVDRYLRQLPVISRPYFYPQNWTGTSLQWRLMKGNLFTSIGSYSSLILRIQISSIG